MFHKENSSVLNGKKKSVDVTLRKSDRRHLKAHAQDLLGSSSPVLDAVFLEGTLTCRKVGQVKLYSRSPDPSSEWPYHGTTQCVWMTVDDNGRVIHAPTVALLAVLPQNSLSTIVVPWNVSKFLCRGANLMRAGMFSLPTTLNKDGIVALQVEGNPQAFAVGQVTANTTNETIGPNATGVGVNIWTCYGDDLWRHQVPLSSNKDEGMVNPTGGASFDNRNYGNVGFLDGKVVKPIVSIKDNEGGSDVEETQDSAEASSAPDTDEQREQQEEKETVDSSESPDTVLHIAVCHALVNIKDSQLPMTMENLYAQHVIPHASSTIQLKSTKWKKFGKYMQDQVDRGLFTVKENGTNKTGYLTGIDRRHQDLIGIKKDPTETKENSKSLAIVNLYMIPRHFVSLLRLNSDAVMAVNAKSEERRGTGMLTAPEARAILDQYVKENEMIINSQQVQLDGPLSDALFKKKDAPDIITRKDLTLKWTEKLEAAHALVEMPGNRIIKLARGKAPTVSIEIALRKGRKNKFVTFIRGLEDYGIDPIAFQKDVSTRFACSGTVETDTQGRAALKKGHVELVFQGHLLEELRALLLGDERLSSHGGAKSSDYCIPKSAIDVTLRKGVSAKKKKR